jgi:HEAT repeat protein
LDRFIGDLRFMKKTLSLIFLLSTVISVDAQTSKVKFIKGNIADKTAAVREAGDSDSQWITEQAVAFCLENKEALGNDRELDGLAVAAILSYTPENVKKQSDSQKQKLTDNFISLFTQFNKSSTVQIAVISKAVGLKDTVPTAPFTALLNSYLKTADVKTADSGVFKASINALESIGNDESFKLLYQFLNNNAYSAYKKEIEKTTITLIPNAMNEVLSLLKGSDLTEIASLFDLVQKNSKISKKNLCEIAENVLSESILLVDNSSEVSQDTIKLQLTALNALNENNWTLASSNVLSYFDFSKKLYEKKNMTEDQFKTVIISLRNIAPLDAVAPLISYLEELNDRTEKGNPVSSEIALAVINTLGAIGDKAAFDSLLAVTYLNYEESVLTAARAALSGLRWQ